MTFLAKYFRDKLLITAISNLVPSWSVVCCLFTTKKKRKCSIHLRSFLWLRNLAVGFIIMSLFFYWNSGHCSRVEFTFTIKWFWCIPSLNSYWFIGFPTTICDGIQVWKETLGYPELGSALARLKLGLGWLKLSYFKLWWKFD